MSFLKLAEDRYSVRSFSSKPVEKDKLELILKAGQLSPTACNFQPQRILVIESSEALEKLKKCTPCHFNAPTALLVCYDKSKSWKRPHDGDDSGAVDASIVCTHMILEAAELGLGTTWVGFFDPALVRSEFSLPDDIIPVAILPLGYASEDSKPAEIHYQRLPIEETVSYNSF
ncbi:MAG: nitroreductase [Clostridiales bacterium]|jgi:nitroreductase|nr:nitroreductase [Clostridiales bacterium]